MLREFNGLGQLIAEYQAHGAAVNTGTTPKVQYAYSEMASSANHSRPTSMTYPNGKVLTSNYASGINNDISRLSSLSDTGGTLESYSYLGLGTVVERKHPLPTSPASSLDLTYITSSPGDAGDQYGGLDRFGRIVDQNWIVDDGTPASVDRFEYTHDRNSNRLTKSNYVSNAVYSLDLDETYTYDGLNQISTFDRDDGYDQDWTYDGLGNWASFNDDGASQTRTHNAQNEILTISGATNPAYDNNGNMITDETNKDLKYDAWNRMVEVKDASNNVIATYEYDALKRRIQETEGGSTKVLYYTAQWQVIEERDEARTNDVIQQYVWSPVYIDAMILRDKDTADDGTLDERLYAIHDANFNITALMDTTGTVVERITYTPFGVATIHDGDFTVDTGGSDYAWSYRHQGGRWSAESNFVDFRNRPLSPTLGRWMMNDPIGYLSSVANFYLYLRNNTTASSDPFGLLDNPAANAPVAPAAPALPVQPGPRIGPTSGVAPLVPTPGINGRVGAGSIIQSALIREAIEENERKEREERLDRERNDALPRYEPDLDAGIRAAWEGKKQKRRDVVGAIAGGCIGSTGGLRGALPEAGTHNRTRREKQCDAALKDDIKICDEHYSGKEYESCTERAYMRYARCLAGEEPRPRLIP